MPVVAPSPPEEPCDGQEKTTGRGRTRTQPPVGAGTGELAPPARPANAGAGHAADRRRGRPRHPTGAGRGTRLLFLDRDDDLARLLGQFPDEGSAAWAYT